MTPVSALATTTRVDPVNAVGSLAERIRAECADMDTTRRVPLRDARTAVQHICTEELHYELAGRQLLGREIAASPWALDYRGES